MTDWLSKDFYNNSIENWAFSLILIIGAFIIGKVILWLFTNVIKKAAEKTKTKADDIILNIIEKPAIFIITIIGIWLGLYRLNFSPSLKGFIQHGMILLITLTITWLIVRLVSEIIEQYLVPIAQKSENDLDDQIIPIIKKGLKLGIWVLGSIVALNNAGFNVGALIAGLGIGGLAFAMAAKDSISNIFGGITIFADRHFRLNDRIKVAGYDGSVKDIGIRSTRLQTLEGRMVSIPNSKFTDTLVENVTSEPTRKVVLNLGLTYDTDHKQMNKAIEILKDIANSNESVDGNFKIAFSGFGDFSLNILFIYYITKEGDILMTQNDMNMSILERFNNENLEFAFPTQTIYNIKS
ncbi:MAG TPA: mechanosensitive ion channel family protein [Bacteroidetes bacterium]|nr:mechanosensitive ion channel family protein [Bacteroidota bacterium]